MSEDKINSNESEGAFNEFLNDQIENLIEDIINKGGIEELGNGGSEIVVEMDDITPPVFEFDNGGGAHQTKIILTKDQEKERDTMFFNIDDEKTRTENYIYAKGLDKK